MGLLGGFGLRAQGPIGPANPYPSELIERLGLEWEVQLGKGDVRAVTARFDIRRMAEKALATVPGEAGAKREFVDQYAKGAAASLAQTLKGFTGCKFLGVVRTNAAGGGVFRFFLPDGGVNYHRYLLETGPAGEAQVTDLFALTTGEWTSASVRWLYLLSEGKGGPKLASALTGWQGELVLNAAAVERMIGFQQARSFAAFVEQYRSLPKALREERTLLHGYLVAAQATDPLQFGLGAETWQRLYPLDPGLDLVTFERLAKQGDHAGSAAALARIESFVGGDMHLRALRGAQLALAGNLDQGRALAAEAVQVEPMLATGYDVLIGISLKKKEFGETARLLTDVGDRLPVDPKELVRVQPQYGEFRESLEGRRWMTNRTEIRVPRKPKPSGFPDAPPGF